MAQCGVCIEGEKSEGGTCHPVGAAVFSERRKRLWMDIFIAKLWCVLGSGRTEDHGAPAMDILGYCDNNDDLRSFLLKQAIIKSQSYLWSAKQWQCRGNGITFGHKEEGTQASKSLPLIDRFALYVVDERRTVVFGLDKSSCPTGER